MSMLLEERTMLIKLSISTWQAQKTDRKVSNEVLAQKKAKTNRGKFRKVLITREAFAGIQRVETAARNTFRTYSLPWNDDGSRIITVESYEKIAKAMRKHRQDMQKEVQDFLDKYDEHIKQAKAEMPGMFNEADYPPRDVIARKYNFSFDVEPLPVAKDFRAKVSNAESKAIIKGIEDRTKARLEAAINNIWERVLEKVKNMYDHLSDFKPRDGLRAQEGKLTNAMIKNIKELAELMPSLNVTNNPEVTKVQKQLLADLCAFNVEELKTDAKSRLATQKKAKQIFDKVSKYLA